MTGPRLVAEFGLGIKVTEDGKVEVWSIDLQTPAVLPEAQKAKPNHVGPQRRTIRRQPVEIDSIEYPSVSEAAREYGISRWTVKDRCASDAWPTWVIPE